MFNYVLRLCRMTILASVSSNSENLVQRHPKSKTLFILFYQGKYCSVQTSSVCDIFLYLRNGVAQFLHEFTELTFYTGIGKNLKCCRGFWTIVSIVLLNFLFIYYYRCLVESFCLRPVWMRMKLTGSEENWSQTTVSVRHVVDDGREEISPTEVQQHTGMR